MTEAAGGRYERRVLRRDLPSPAEALHLLALSTFGVAQPLFDLLSRAPEFFAVRRSTPSDIVLLALMLTFAPPLILLGLEALAGLILPRARRILHVVFLAALAALVALQVVKRIVEGPGSLLVLAALVAGVAAALAVTRARIASLFLAVLGGASIVFLGLFLFGSPVAKLLETDDDTDAGVAVQVDAKAPVVVVVFDAFLGTAIQDGKRRIDARRFPHFAALAEDATWFRHVTTVHEHTTYAVPAILTGKRPEQGKLPRFSDHPDNLFTLLGGSYRIEAIEPVAHLCPERLCRESYAEGFGDRMRSLASDLSIVYLHVLLPEDVAARFPSVTDGWRDFRDTGKNDAAREARKRPKGGKEQLYGGLPTDRSLQFANFVASIEEDDRQPTLYFLHVLLPHLPFAYLPSGREYGNVGPVFGSGKRGWTSDQWFLTQQYDRYLRQVGFVDRLLGQLVAKLKDTGLYDRALVVVTADHGMSFRPNEPGRAARDANVHEIAHVPLFVKAPAQRRGRIVETSVQTIDILPTIADALGIRIPWPVDGRSALDTQFRGRDRIVIPRVTGGNVVVSSSEIKRRTDAGLLAWRRTLGADPDPAGYFRVGPYRELLGRRVAELAVRPSDELRVDLAEAGDLESVDPRSGFVPAHIAGRVSGDGAAEGVPIAIAVNGRVAAVTPTVAMPDGIWFASLVPESSLRPGRNAVEVYRIGFDGTLERLAR